MVRGPCLCSSDWLVWLFLSDLLFENHHGQRHAMGTHKQPQASVAVCALQNQHNMVSFERTADVATCITPQIRPPITGPTAARFGALTRPRPRASRPRLFSLREERLGVVLRNGGLHHLPTAPTRRDGFRHGTSEDSDGFRPPVEEGSRKRRAKRTERTGSGLGFFGQVKRPRIAPGRSLLAGSFF